MIRTTKKIIAVREMTNADGVAEMTNADGVAEMTNDE
jgi:hypothetical protein